MDELKPKMFYAACVFIMVGLIYCFVCIWEVPVVDLSAPILGLIMLFVGFYWGSSKSTKDNADIITKQIDNAADLANKKEEKEEVKV